MAKRLILVILACGLAAASSGCCFFNGLACGGPLGACGGPCGPLMASGCGGGCATDCGPACGSACPTDCQAPCDTACAGPCDVGCGPSRYPCGPLSLVFGLINQRTWCGSGCGERYRGDWCGDPPDCHDPCDRCGNWTGGRGMVAVDPRYQPELISSTTGPAKNAGSSVRTVRSRRPQSR